MGKRGNVANPAAMRDRGRVGGERWVKKPEGLSGQRLQAENKDLWRRPIWEIGFVEKTGDWADVEPEDAGSVGDFQSCDSKY
jgi:hypothetical protein